MATNAITKRLQISQANSKIVIITSVAAFIVVFSLVAAKTLISQATYQSRVISAKNEALTQLRSDVSATSELKTQYDAFVNASTNVLGGDATGTGAKDGDNAKIILHALPSNYDFPALATSIEKIISTNDDGTPNTALTINSITGTDDEVAQSANTSSTTPAPVAIPFQVAVTGDYASVQTLIGKFEHSIRPFQIQTLDISGDQDKLTVTISAQTFYQPAKLFNTTKTKVVK
jgi:hypothetical protein